MSNADAMALAAAERADVADLLDTLTPPQWESPSLCDGWRVRDVVAHLIGYEGQGLRLLTTAVRGRFSLHRMNSVVVDDWSGRDTADLVATVRRHLRPSGPTAAFGGRVGLLDGLVHHQDVRRPLGLPREVPADRLAEALRFVPKARPLRAGPRIRGLRLVATDLDIRIGDGQEVTGPAEALLMAAAGRADALPELSGPGARVLADRIRGGQRTT